MLHTCESSFIDGLEGVKSRRLSTAAFQSPAGSDATLGDDGAQLASFAVITVRNDTSSPVTFDLRVLPTFQRFLTFHLEPGQERAFLSALQSAIDSPQFQVEFLSIPGRAHTHSARTLIEFNVLQTPLGRRIDHKAGRLYVFRSTASGRDLFLD
jgi:hypothetical protein